MQGNNDLFAVLLARAVSSGGGGTGTVTSITAGTGLTTADGSDITTSGTIKTKLASETALSGNDVYPVGVNDNGELAVEVSMSASDVGLGNVTNDAQVKKISSSTSGDIVTWGAATGDTVADSGKSFETTLTSSSDAKIPTSKAVASYVSNEIGKLDGGTIGIGSAAKTITTLSQSNGNVSATFADIAITASQSTLGSWTAGTATTHSTPSGTDTVLQALQKIDNNQRNDENNILSLIDTGAKNMIDVDTTVIETAGFVIPANTPFVHGAGEYTISFSSTNAIAIGANIVFDNDNSEILRQNITINAGDNVQTFTLPSAAKKVRWYITGATTISNLMICTSTAYNTSPAYVPYCPTLAEVYAMVKALQT